MEHMVERVRKRMEVLLACTKSENSWITRKNKSVSVMYVHKRPT